MALTFRGLSLLVLAVLLIELEALRIARPPNKPGKCPRSRSLRRGRDDYHRWSCDFGRCTSDYHCPEDQKCCGCPKRCRDPVVELPKPGVCPPIPPTLPEVCAVIDVVVECTNDQDCSGDKKCCGTMCGGRVCDLLTTTTSTTTTTTTTRPTYVENPLCPPASFPPECAFVRVRNVCDSDSECLPENKICCPAFCGARDCVRARFTPSDKCPIVSNPLPDFCAARTSIPECSSDADCRYSLCCPDECGVLMCKRKPHFPY